MRSSLSFIVRELLLTLRTPSIAAIATLVAGGVGVQVLAKRRPPPQAAAPAEAAAAQDLPSAAAAPMELSAVPLPAVVHVSAPSATAPRSSLPDAAMQAMAHVAAAAMAAVSHIPELMRGLEATSLSLPGQIPLLIGAVENDLRRGAASLCASSSALAHRAPELLRALENDLCRGAASLWALGSVLAHRALELLRPAVNSLGVLMLPLAHGTPDLVRVLERDLCQGAASLWVLGTTLAHRTPELFRQLHQRLPPEAHGLALAAHASAALVLAGFLRRQLPPSWTGARLRPSSETKSTVPATVSAAVPAPVPAPVPSTAAEAGLVVRTAHHNAAEQKAARIADWIRGGNPWAEQGFVPMSDAQRPRTGVRDRLAKQRQELAEQLSVQTAKAIGRAAPVAAAPMATMTKHEEPAPESPAALHRPSKLSLPVPAPEAAASRSPPARAAEGDLLLHVTTASPSRVSSLSGASPLRPAGGSPARSPTRSPANRRVQPPVECDSCMCNPGTEYLNAGTWLRLLSAEQRRHEEGWLAKLDSEQFRVLRMKGTEPIHSGEYNDTFEQGHYACAGCGAVLYSSKHKPRSLAGHGWPAFSESLPGALERIVHPPKKIEIVCAACGGHVGHVFKSSRYPAPKHERHCVNSVSLRFMPMGALS